MVIHNMHFFFIEQRLRFRPTTMRFTYTRETLRPVGVCWTFSVSTIYV